MSEEPNFLESKSTRARVLRAALKVFSNKSFHEATMDEVAETAQVSKGGLYLYFSSKQALFVSLIEAVTKMLVGSMESAMDAENSRRKKMHAAITAAFLLFEKHRTIARLVFLRMGGLGPLLDEKIFSAHTLIADLIQTQLDSAFTEEKLPVADTRLVALMWTGAIYEVLVWWLREEDPAPLSSFCDPLYAILLRSIGIAPEADSLSIYST